MKKYEYWFSQTGKRYYTEAYSLQGAANRIVDEFSCLAPARLEYTNKGYAVILDTDANGNDVFGAALKEAV